MSKLLQVSTDLELPPEAVTQTFGILAKRGVGKTYTASVMTEEMLKAQLPVVVCDPIGVWWGLRSSANGKRGKKNALASLTYLDRFFSALAKSVRARTAGHLKAAKGYMAKARSFDTRSGRAEKRARKYFKAAGVPIKRDPASH